VELCRLFFGTKEGIQICTAVTLKAYQCFRDRDYINDYFDDVCGGGGGGQRVGPV
jgi:hypothetical protein